MARRPSRFPDEAARKRARRIARMFDRIAPTYDLLNRVLSARADVRWRRALVRGLALRGGERVLDACTGTADQALALLDGGAGEVVATDFSAAMVHLARKKVGQRIDVLQADTTALPFPDASFDVATVSFGVRNLESLDRGLLELARVLRPGGRLGILEFSRPPHPLVRGLFDLYFRVVLPLIGNLVSGGADNAYSYLPRSVLTFPDPRTLSRRIQAAGFGPVSARPLTLGIAHVHLARRRAPLPDSAAPSRTSPGVPAPGPAPAERSRS